MPGRLAAGVLRAEGLGEENQLLVPSLRSEGLGRGLAVQPWQGAAVLGALRPGAALTAQRVCS